MSGKRLLDTVQFLNVAKSVAGKHLELRQRQADIFTRTSSLTKGIQSQTENIVLTARAATALARRFSDDAEPFPRSKTPFEPASDSTPTTKDESSENVGKPHIIQTDDLDQYITRNTVTADASSRSPPSQEARELQRKAEFQIPSKSAEHSLGPGEPNVSQAQDVYYSPSGESAPTLSGLPRMKIPKATGTVQESDSRLAEPNMNSDVFYSSVQSSGEKNDSEKTDSVTQNSSSPSEQPSEEMLSQLFHSPRVTRMMGSKKAQLSQDGQAIEDPIDGGEESPTRHPQKQAEEMRELGSALAESTTPTKEDASIEELPQSTNVPYRMLESRVPSSRIGRLWQYSGLAASMAFGAVGETFRRATGNGEGSNGSVMFSAGNMERLVAKLSRMRGAALKLGQMMSFQDSRMLPEPIAIVLQRVQDRADYMPASQRDKVLRDNLGPEWRELFQSFDEIPMAAASIGQVHGAILKDGRKVAVKVQYPGVADSIDSDLNNLSILLTASRMLPKGLFLDKTIANARTELAWECDYIREAECGERFRELLQDEVSVFVVPRIIEEASGKQVLTMERMEGTAVTKIQNFTQEQRDWIGTQILRLSLREICDFKFMQTDPNWTNFLYNAETKRIELLDFGASREYPEEFIDTYVRTLVAASRNQRELCRDLSQKLGYLTGFESRAMVEAHVDSILTIAEPFTESAPDVYDFSNQTITDRVRAFIPVMLRERLSPPPEETYSLHRKLSGAFLLCAKLQSRVRCKDLFQIAVRRVETC